MERKCVALISGGLDSALAAKLMLEQGIAVHGLFLSMSWGCCEKPAAQAVAQQLGIPLMVLSMGQAYLDVIKAPKHGYGAGMNPCADCRIYMFKIAKRYMEELGAGFVVTGEVVGQRPMSQMRRQLRLIEIESALEDLLLRPLSARLLEPTLPELLGVVDRSRLLSFSGRSRRQQLALASNYGISGYSQPAGGCLLTDEAFARKVEDLFSHKQRPTMRDMELLRVGRHIRLGPNTKAILGRNELENLLLEGHAQDGATFISPTFAGPSALVVGDWDEQARRAVVRLIIEHTKPQKLPPRDLEFRCDGTLWTVGREKLEKMTQEMGIAECGLRG